MTVKEEIEQLIKENLVSRKELDKRFAETRKLIDSVGKQVAGTERTIAEIGKEVSSTQRTIAEIGKEVSSTQKTIADIGKEVSSTQKTIADVGKEVSSTQRTIADIGKEVSSTQKTIADIGKQLGGIGNSNGAYAEEIFYSSLSKQKKLGKIKYDAVNKNLSFSKKGIQDEFDIVMVNGNSVAIIEVKYKATKEHLKTLIEKKLDSFKKLFPEFKDYQFYLGLAGLSFESKAFEKEVLNKGVALLKAVGEHAEVFADNLKVY